MTGAGNGAAAGTVEALAGRGADCSFSELDGDEMYAIMAARDESFAGVFFEGVTSTGVYCRPGCWAKLPKRENCRFFETASEAEAAGFRACKLCKPRDVAARAG